MPAPLWCRGTESPKRPLPSKEPTEVPHHHQPTTIAILGAGTVVGNALSLLLEGFGYSARLLEYPSAADAGAQLLLEEL